jgi:hypothetical protein
MKIISSFPFIASVSLFGMVAFFAVLLYSLIKGASLVHSDDPYIIGLVLGCVNALGALIYLVLNEVNIKWLKPITSMIIYYCLIAAYCLIVEYIGGEASGYGYFFLTAIVLSIPVLLIFIIYVGSRRVFYTGIVSGLLYFVGYAHVLSGRI